MQFAIVARFAGPPASAEPPVVCCNLPCAYPQDREEEVATKPSEVVSFGLFLLRLCKRSADDAKAEYAGRLEVVRSSGSTAAGIG